MKIYHFNPNNGNFLCEGVADIDPLNSENYLIPANSTTIVPLESMDNKIIVWNGEQWEYKDIEPVDIELLKSMKRQEVSAACKSSIIGGFVSTSKYPDGRLYDSEEVDQLNYLSGLKLIEMGFATTTIPCKFKGGYFEEYTVDEFKQLALVDFPNHYFSNIFKCDQLKRQIDFSTTELELESIVW